MIFKMAAVMSYIKRASHKIYNFLKISPILTKLNMYVHIYMRVILRHDVFIANFQSGRIYTENWH